MKSWKYKRKIFYTICVSNPFSNLVFISIVISEQLFPIKRVFNDDEFEAILILDKRAKPFID